MTNTSKALFYSVTSQYVAKLLNLISIIVVARLLSPSELGVYAISAAVILVTSELKSFGIGNFIIRKKELIMNDIRNALGTAIVISWLIGICLIGSSWSIALFYEKENIALLLQILSISFFISPHISIGTALLIRNFEFKKRFIIVLASQSTNLISTLFLIYLGLSYFSLAIASVLASLVELSLLVYLSSKQIVLFPTFNNLKHMLKFGFYVSFSNTLKRLNLSIVDLVIGKIGPASDVAYFSRGIGFLAFVGNILTQGVLPVTTPYLAELKHKEHNIENGYNKATQLMGSITLPSLAICGVASYPIIILFFGDQWVKSVEIVSILSIWGIFRYINVFAPTLFVTYKHEKSLFIKELILFSLAIIFVIYGYNFGLSGTAWALTTISIIDFVTTSIMLNKLLNFSFYNQAKNLLPNIILVITCGFSTFLISIFIDFKSYPAFIVLSFLIPTALTTWLITIKLLNHPMYAEVNLLLSLIKKKLSSIFSQ